MHITKPNMRILKAIFSSSKISKNGITTNSKIIYSNVRDVRVHTKKNFVLGIVWIRKLNMNVTNIATVVNENIVHHKLIEAVSNIIGRINIGKIASNAICLAPPFQGIRNLSCMVLTNSSLCFCVTLRQVIKLKVYKDNKLSKIKIY